MGKQEQKPTFVVRPIKPADEAAVRALWASGFYDVADDSTRSLSPVALGGPGSLTFSAPRPALAALAVAGTLRAAVAVGRRDGGGVVARSLALAALGVGGLAVLHLTVRHFIAALVAVETTGVGEMAAISDTWLVPGRRAFFVAVTHDDTVLGCAAVRVGDTEDEDVTPGVCSAWRVSTARAARGLGVGKTLMATVERWARDEGGAKKLRLVTGGIAAKARGTVCRGCPVPPSRRKALLLWPRRRRRQRRAVRLAGTAGVAQSHGFAPASLFCPSINEPSPPTRPQAFYSAIGYTMWKGSLRGTNYSFWEKALV